MDGVPISEALARCDVRFARAWWHWFFLAQPEVPERGGDPRPADGAGHGRGLPGAGLGIDLDHEQRDRAAGRRVQCPTLFLWSSRDDMQSLYDDPVAIWRTWVADERVSAVEIHSGHHMAEENPVAVADAIGAFLDSHPLT